MSLLVFKLPAEDVRLIDYEGTIYKIKLKYESKDAFLPCSQRELNKQVEQVLRSLLHTKYFTHKHLKTEHFNVDCHSYKWDALKLVGFSRNNKTLDAHPFVIVMNFTPRGLNQSRGKHEQEFPCEDTRTASNSTKDTGGPKRDCHGVNHKSTRKPLEFVHGAPKDPTEFTEQLRPKERSHGKKQLNEPEEKQGKPAEKKPLKYVSESKMEEDKGTNTRGSRTGKTMHTLLPVHPVVYAGIAEVPPAKKPKEVLPSVKEKSCYDPLLLIQTPQKVLRVDLGRKITEKELVEKYGSSYHKRASGDFKGHETSSHKEVNVGVMGDGLDSITTYNSPPVKVNAGVIGDGLDSTITHNSNSRTVQRELRSGRPDQPADSDQMKKSDLSSSTSLHPPHQSQHMSAKSTPPQFSPMKTRKRRAAESSSACGSSSQQSDKMRVFKKHRPRKSLSEESTPGVRGRSRIATRRSSLERAAQRKTSQRKQPRCLRKRRSSYFGQALDNFLESFC